MDSTSTSTCTGPSLLNLNYQNSLYDAWRWLHAGERDFTFFSTPNQFYSCIDIFLVDQGLFSKTINMTINSITWSDHASVALTVADSLASGAIPIWRANPLLLQRDNTKKALERHLNEYFKDNVTSVTDHFILWNAHKAFMWGIFIKLGAGVKRQRQRQLKALADSIHNLENLNKKNPSPLKHPSN